MNLIAELFRGLRVPGSATQVFADPNDPQPQQELVSVLLAKQFQEDRVQAMHREVGEVVRPVTRPDIEEGQRYR